MKRFIQKELSKWKDDSSRKILLIRGARQVGKTYSIRQLGSTFKNYIEVNFEENKDIKQFFSGSLNPDIICKKISAAFSLPIIPGETLLFFDEIQECPEALSALRFFYEKLPDLHVIAAGSLLEFAIESIPSYGVGRIQSLFMYPMSFDEFLMANNEEGLLELKNIAGTGNPLDNLFHHKLVDYLKMFYLTGGMPESVKEYLQSGDILKSQKVLDGLIESIKDDFAKYKNRSPIQRLEEVYGSISMQCGSKFVYSRIDSSSSHAPLKDALELIVQAGLAYKVYHTSSRGIPLGAQVKIKKFKVIPHDIGIHQRLLGLNAADIVKAENVTVINKGHIAEIFVGLELIKNTSPYSRATLHYWHKEKRGSNAEVDYVIQREGDIVPIEVKSGTQGKMQSMRIFMEERKLKHGIRISLEPFSSYGNIEVIPLYAISNIIKERVA
ncbi:MAG: AAA family ATPase [Candidatus Omnitrophota bacterium]